MNTFCVQTLGCKVNQYESDQVASLLRRRGLTEAPPADADLRVVNTCSVTVQAASKSRQTTRRLVRLPLLGQPTVGHPTPGQPTHNPAGPSIRLAATPTRAARPRVVVMGCWATSDPAAASAIAGVDAVLTHHGDVAGELDRLLTQWLQAGDHNAGGLSTTQSAGSATIDTPTEPIESPLPEPLKSDGWMKEAGTPAGTRTRSSKATSIEKVNANLAVRGVVSPARAAISRDVSGRVGTTTLPLLDERQPGRQRAFLKVQDGCDAHCTYCIIPRLRPALWSKPVDDAVEEARRLVAAGHVEIVLTGIFLSAYGQPTALHRRQVAGGARPLGELVTALCTRVPGLRRVRLSSLEPGDLTDDLLRVLREHEQVVPHFHLPLQSGSDQLLRQMNRQYTRDEFLRMIDRVRETFDRPAFTTDVIVGFPGETDEEFRRTVEVVEHARFIHVHAFSFSPRPGTAAARRARDFVRGPVVNERIETLRRAAEAHSFDYRRQFLGETVEVLVERDDTDEGVDRGAPRHGRCERYFDVHFDHPSARPGDFLRLRIDRVTPRRTYGTVVGDAAPERVPA